LSGAHCITIAALLLNGDGRRAGNAYVRSIMRKRQATYLIITAVAGFALVVTALATPGFGVLSAPVLARANFLDPVDIKFKIKHGSQEVLHVSNTRETVVQQIVLSPGGHTGWHSHPGPVVVLVKAGALTFYSGENPECVAAPMPPGKPSSTAVRDMSILRGMRVHRQISNCGRYTSMCLQAVRSESMLPLPGTALSDH
jgi:hypothetical protein